jgi:ABC-2 type transport system permease protein
MPRRLIRVIRVEVFKLFHQKLFYLAVAVPAFMALATGLGLKVFERVDRLAGGPALPVNGFYCLASAVKNGLGIASIFLLVFAGSLLAKESELGTLKSVLTRPVRRIEVLLGKLVTLALLTLVVLIVLQLAGLAVGGLFFGYGPIRDVQHEEYIYYSLAEMERDVLKASLLAFPPLFALSTLGLLLSSLTDESFVAVGTSAGIYLFFEVLTWLFEGLRPYFCNYYIKFPFDVVLGHAQGLTEFYWKTSEITGSLICSLFYVLVFVVLSAVSFCRKNVLA